MPRIGSKPPALPKNKPSKPKTKKAPRKPGLGKKPTNKPVE
jgi:hypothetical protein